MFQNKLIQTNKFSIDFKDNEKILFCKIDFIFSEFENIKRIGKNIALIVGNSDYTLTDDILSRCPNNVKYIFATNTNSSDDRVIPIPLGVENEYPSSRNGHGITNNEIFEKLPYLTSSEIVAPSINNKVYANFSVPPDGSHLYGIFKGYRNSIKEICEKTNYIDFENEKLDFNTFIKKTLLYPASVSPIGNGIECIRTYELMYLNRIPIVVGGLNLHKVINKKIYGKLPLVFIEDVNLLSDEKYIFNSIEKASLKSKECLDYDYWKNLIEEKIKTL